MKHAGAAEGATSSEHGGEGVRAQSIVLDTDIGTDVDDILALAVILGSPELSLAGVTTVYGDVLLRARMAARAIRSAGAPIPPIVPGRSTTLSGRPVWWPGHEGKLMLNLESESIDDGSDAISLLAGSTTVIGIGPLTDLAALVEYPGHVTRRAYLMGGNFGMTPRVEHNIRCDVAAADTVFNSSMELTITGLEQTERVRIGAKALDQITTAGPFGRLLAAEMQQFWQFANQDYNVPHDAIAVLSAIRPDLFEFARGRVSVETFGEDTGLTRFATDEAGPHHIISDLDARAVSEEIVQRILISTHHSNAQLNEEKHQ